MLERKGREPCLAAEVPDPAKIIVILRPFFVCTKQVLFHCMDFKPQDRSPGGSMAEKTSYRLSVSRVESEGIPGVDTDLGMISVVLGANGSGKSRLLQRAVSNSSFQDRHIVFVGGGRSLDFPVAFGSSHSPTRTPAPLLAFEPLNSRASRFFAGMFGRDQQAATDYKEAMFECAERGDLSNKPSKPVPEIAKFGELFNEVFPSLKLEQNFDFKSAGQQYLARKGNSTYHPNGLSDGEKQILAFLSAVQMVPKRVAFLVDEPEQNLHPELANRFWTQIEEAFPDGIFLYATHSLSFATRGNVDSLLLLGPDGQTKTIKEPWALEESELRPFLGTIPAVVKSGKVLFAEGKNHSFDKDFYTWLLSDPDILVVPAEGCGELLSIAKGSRLWQQFSTELKLKSVIDRDFRCEEDLRQVSDRGCRVTEYHEAESYFCVPDILVALANELRNQVKAPTKEDVIDHLCKYCESQLVRTCLQRAQPKYRFTIDIPLEGQAIDGVKNDPELARQALKQVMEIEATKLDPKDIAKQVDELFVAEYASAKKAIDRKNIDEMLRIFPAKEMANRLAHLVGCRDRHNLSAAIRNRFSPERFPQTESLRKLLSF